MIQILVADPNITCRDLFAQALTTVAGLTILHTCPNGKLCLDNIRKHKPEMVVAAAELGDMNIVQFLAEALAIAPHIGVVVVTKPDNPVQANLAVLALGGGAFDYLVKPSLQCTEADLPHLTRLLAPKIMCFTINRFSEMAKRTAHSGGKKPVHGEPPQESAPVIVKHLSSNNRYRVVLIGVSTGGPEALSRIMPLFPENFPLPLVIVLHMPKLFTGAMAKNLDAKSAITVHEAQDHDVLQAGHAYLAPGGIHLVLDSGTRGNLIVKTQEGQPENGCKPAVDILFRSASRIVKEKAIGVILTGMGVDGTSGARALKDLGVPIIAQDEATSVVWGMPGNIVKSGIATEVLPLLQIPKKIVDMVTTND